MTTVKGIAPDLLLFFLGSIVYLRPVFGPISSTKATSANLLFSWTIWNPYYGLAFVASLALGCWIVRRMSVRA